MSHSHTHESITERAAGGIEGLSLGAPIGGGASANIPGNAGYSSTTTTNTFGQGLTGAHAGHSHSQGEGLTGSHAGHSHSHVDNQGEAHRTAVGSVASNAQNSTSGERGIGGGRGGPTAYEADARDVGINQHQHSQRSSALGRDHIHNDNCDYDDEPHRSHTHTDNCNHKSNTTGLAAKAKAALSRDHVHDNNCNYDDDVHRSHVHNDSCRYTGTGSRGATTGAVAGAGLAGIGSSTHTSRAEGPVDDSVTGQQHFAGSSTTTSTHTHHTGAGLAGVGAGAGIGAGAAGLAQKSHHTGASSLGHKTNPDNAGTGPGAELKKELKEHQQPGGYSDATEHAESKGPHGLVWHNGKYVHQRELDGHGSTGVPLK